MKGFYKKCETCKKDFWIIPSVLKRNGRGRFCSKKCWYETKIGNPSWNKGLVGIQKAWNKGKECWWKEEKHPLWKEKDYGYSAVHNWVRKYKGDYPIACEHCGKIGKKEGKRWNLEWANINHKYKRKLNDYIALCPSCHKKYDYENGWGIATKMFSLCA